MAKHMTQIKKDVNLTKDFQRGNKMCLSDKEFLGKKCILNQTKFLEKLERNTSGLFE